MTKKSGVPAFFGRSLSKSECSIRHIVFGFIQNVPIAVLSNIYEQSINSRAEVGIGLAQDVLSNIYEQSINSKAEVGIGLAQDPLVPLHLDSCIVEDVSHWLYSLTPALFSFAMWYPSHLHLGTFLMSCCISLRGL